MPPGVIESSPPIAPSEVSPRTRNSIFLYLGGLYLIRPFTTIWSTTASFFLKDHLHLSAVALAGYGFYAGIPAYFGFLFGLIRDRWAPFGRRDQGLLFIASSGMAALLFGLSVAPLTFPIILAVALAKESMNQLAMAAQRGMTSVLGQEHVMSGRLSALWQTVETAPGFIVPVIAGYCAVHFAPSTTFRIAGLVAVGFFAFSWWRPKAVYEDPAEGRPIRTANFGAEILRLAKTPAMYPVTLLLLLWNFTPGAGTPMQFYLTNTLHGTAQDFGNFNAIFSGFFVPTFLLHGYLCTRFPLRPILWVSTCFAVPQILPLLFVHSAASALWAGVPMGLMGGFATAAYFDLLIRSCPEGLEGTAMMLGASVWALSGALGNVAGAYIYNWGGFAPCAWSTAAVYALQLPVLLFVPRALTGTRDGEIVAA